MTKIFTLATALLLIGTAVHAQKKSELITKVSELEKEIVSLNDSLSRVNRTMNTAISKSELLEKENTELKDANTTLLGNLTNFSKISKKNTETVNNALATLSAKEKQMRIITDTFSSNDSTAIAILTQAKQTLGPEATVGIAGGDIVISNSLPTLFGSDSGSALTATGKDWVTRIAEIIKKNPSRTVAIEGLNITGEFDLTYKQVQAVANGLIAIDGIGAEKLQLLAKDGNFSEGVQIRLAPDYKGFYTTMKSEFK
ncbi:hypothetical protein [Flavobacterium sp. ASW18X]|uniref:hypothetical protein n=1 Tax=Flavobacterium sp. ASW18X TaxID=2572595 RepID=UPI0010ADC190|nr:hypothetical protein [Flavobacterium sp. ASW18X]TKD65954.1 hypothetical protein FBT53_03550 [Flavobacterium sp. ASW18X]